MSKELADILAKLKKKIETLEQERDEARANAGIRISQIDLYTFLHTAIGYAFGRSTYITTTVPCQVRTYWKHLEPGMRTTLTRNLRSDVDAYTRIDRKIGHDCDDASWRSLLAWMEENQ